MQSVFARYAVTDYNTKKGSHHADMCVFVMHPMALFAKGNITAGKLTLVPVVPLQFIICQVVTPPAGHSLHTGNFVEVGQEKLQLCISKPPNFSPAKDNVANVMVHPFFWVGKTSDKKASNMSLKVVEHKGFKIPVLVNHCDIEQHAKICVFEAAKVKASSVAPPTKKPRTR